MFKGYDVAYFEQSITDMKNIKEYFDTKQESKAGEKILDSIEHRIKKIQETPNIYPRYIDDNSRRHSTVSGYTIFYHVNDGEGIVEIHRILHSAMNMREWLE